MPTKWPSVPINVDLGAKAEAKLTVETRVPEKTSGRFVDAITDILSPFSEGRGLKGDQIRLQREDVAYKIALMARDRILLEAEEYKFIPTKILVPLLEAASLEEPDDITMHDLWANLLASAAGSEVSQPRFIGVLKELNPTQAKLLQSISFKGPLNLESWEECERKFIRLQNVETELDWAIFSYNIRASINKPDADCDTIFKDVLNEFKYAGALLWHFQIRFENENQEKYFDRGQTISPLDLDVLQSLGLIQKFNGLINSNDQNSWVHIEYYIVTSLAHGFLWECTDWSVGKPQE